MLEKINGLPAHVLLVHAVVVLLPVGALMLIASAVWPAARAKLGFLTPAVAFVALVLVPVTTHAGEWLRDHLGFTSPAIRKHVELGHQLLPWAFGIFVMATVVWVLHRRHVEMVWRPRGRGTVAPAVDDPGAEPGTSGGGTTTMTAPATARKLLPVWVTAVITVLSIVVAVGGTVELVRIGDSGAKAVWTGVGSH